MVTIGDELGQWPAFQTLLGLVDVPLSMPVRTYTEQTVAGDEAVEPNTVGLVCYKWEEGDELHLDGKVLWRTNSARYFQEAYAVVGGVVKHYSIDNDCVHLSAYNDDVQLPCKVCPDHGTEIASNVVGWQWCDDGIADTVRML